MCSQHAMSSACGCVCRSLDYCGSAGHSNRPCRSYTILTVCLCSICVCAISSFSTGSIFLYINFHINLVWCNVLALFCYR